VEVRQARSEDLAALLDLEVEYTDSEETFADVVTRFEAFPELFVVADEGGEIVGEASGVAKGGRVTLTAIAVQHRLQRRGIGKRLLETFERGAARYAGIVDVGAGAESEAFYLRCGYRAASLLVRVRRGELPADYQEKGYRVAGLRDRGEDTYLYVEDVAYAPEVKAKVREAFRARSVNYIFERELAPGRRAGPTT
jgi:N-acetylglutamate synthase-like GNAT family acetyltransferase